MREMILFFVDDAINIVYNKRVINIKLKNILARGFVIERKKFMEEFVKILKKERIKGKLFGDKIYIVKNTYFSTSDLFFLENIFLELGFLKVEFMDIKELFSIDNATFVEINNTYMIINFDRGIYLDLDYFKDIPRILTYFESVLKKNIILFGINKNIPNIKVRNKNIYYYDNYDKYLTESLLQVNKNDE